MSSEEGRGPGSFLTLPPLLLLPELNFGVAGIASPKKVACWAYFLLLALRRERTELLSDTTTVSGWFFNTESFSI